MKLNGMGIDPADRQALKNLYEKLSADDLILLEKYINIRANRRVRAALIDLERLHIQAFVKVREHKGITR